MVLGSTQPLTNEYQRLNLPLPCASRSLNLPKSSGPEACTGVAFACRYYAICCISLLTLTSGPVTLFPLMSVWRVQEQLHFNLTISCAQWAFREKSINPDMKLGENTAYNWTDIWITFPLSVAPNIEFYSRPCGSSRNKTDGQNNLPDVWRFYSVGSNNVQ